MATGKEIYLDGWIDRGSRLPSEPNRPFDNIQERYKSVLIKNNENISINKFHKPIVM